MRSIQATPSGFQSGPDPSPAERQQAQAACLRERARVVADAGEVVPVFTRPSWHELQREESQLQDAIAEQIALHIFGASTRDRLTPRIAADIEQAALYAVRRIHPEWVRAAHDQAEDTLLQAEEFGGLFARLPPERRRAFAILITRAVWGALIGTLEGRIPLKPSIYLTVAAARTEAGARS